MILYKLNNELEYAQYFCDNTDRLFEKVYDKILVIGVGSPGCTVVEYMLEVRSHYINSLVIDKDPQVIEQCQCPNTILIGKHTKPRPFCTAPPEWCRTAAMDDIQTIENEIKGYDLIFLVACLGGCTGTGATPVIVELCKDMEITCIAIITTPFLFEGKKRGERARKGLLAVKKFADMTIEISYTDLMKTLSSQLLLIEVHKIADDVILKSMENIFKYLKTSCKT